MVMIASSIANYTIISLASYITKTGGAAAPRMILLLNMGVTIVGILLALYVKKNKKVTVKYRTVTSENKNSKCKMISGRFSLRYA